MLAALVATGCDAAPGRTPAVPTGPAPSGPPTSPPGTPPGPTLVPTTEPASLPPFDCGATLRVPGTVPVARLTGLDAANADGVGRITFSFRPEGNVAATPEVEVRPGTPPFVRDPSGLPLEVSGASFVVITLRGGTALDPDYTPTFEGPFDLALQGGPIVEVRRAGDFEAVSSFVVGLDGAPCPRILRPGSGQVIVELQTAVLRG